jgi:hypothetical protein
MYRNIIFVLMYYRHKLLDLIQILLLKIPAKYTLCSFILVANVPKLLFYKHLIPNNIGYTCVQLI